MTVLFVIPAKENLTKVPRILNGTKPLRKRWTIFQRLELGFGIRIIIADMGSAVCFGYSQISKEMSNDLLFHAGSAIRMDSQLASLDMLLNA